MARRSNDRAYGGAASFPRTRRVNQFLREIVAEEIERLADADERLRLLTVTDVATAADLRHATIFLGSLSEEAAEALDQRRVQIQSAVGKQSRMKRTPKLSFELDPAVTEGARIDEVLRRLHDNTLEE
jgi:ribosome-binding factor A